MTEYLAIDGWEEFQKYRGRRASFILDATDQNEKPKLSGLSHFVRSVLQELRRARGRTGKNIPYDIAHIARATHTIPTDRPHLHHALLTLISRGILVVTNQQVNNLNSGEIKRENKIENKKEPSAAATPRGVRVNNSRVAKATGETRHSRMREMVSRWYQEWAGQECPWDGSEAKQLDSLLKSTPGWGDSHFVDCLVNLARSDCVPKGDRPREWLGKLPKFLHGPLDRFWKAEGNGYVSKAQQRQDASNDAIRTALARITGKDGGLAESGLPLLGDDSRDGGIVLEGNGQPGGRSRKASAGSSD